MKLQHDLKSKETKIEQLTKNVDEFTSKLNAVEFEKNRYVSQLEENMCKYCDVKQELDSVKETLSETENHFKEAERSKTELKEKAVQAIKE